MAHPLTPLTSPYTPHSALHPVHPYTLPRNPLSPPPCQVMKQVVAWKKLNTEPDAMMRFKQLNNMPL